MTDNLAPHKSVSPDRPRQFQLTVTETVNKFRNIKTFMYTNADKIDPNV